LGEAKRVDFRKKKRQGLYREQAFERGYSPSPAKEGETRGQALRGGRGKKREIDFSISKAACSFGDRSG